MNTPTHSPPLALVIGAMRAHGTPFEQALATAIHRADDEQRALLCAVFPQEIRHFTELANKDHSAPAWEMERSAA